MRRTLTPVLALALTLPPAVGCGQDAPEDAALRAMIDEVLPTIASISGLEPLEPVRVEWPTQTEIRSYVEAQLRDEMPAEEMAGLEAVYKGLGLLPPELDLRGLLLELYTEQIVGYYDPSTETLYVLEGVAPDAVRPVLTHELVHALQDQHVNLDSLVSRERGNDRQLAAQAAVEGQATLVMMVALLSRVSGGQPLDPRQLPALGEEMLRPALEAENSQFPVFRSAPRIIRETLLFPYLHGAIFVQALWRSGAGSLEAAGPPLQPFGANLPLSTEQVLHPGRRFLEARDAPTAIELEPAAAGWSTVYENGLGELELSILLEEHLGDAGRGGAQDWDGDAYRLLEADDGARGLVHYSVWDDDAAADRFADLYRRVLETRPDRHGRVERLSHAGRPLVRVVEADDGVPLERIPVAGVAGLSEPAR